MYIISILLGSSPYFISDGKQYEEDRDGSIVFDLLVNDVHDAHETKTIPIFYTFQFLLASARQVERITTFGIEILNAKDWIFLKLCLICGLLFVGIEENKAGDTNQHKNNEDVAELESKALEWGLWLNEHFPSWLSGHDS